MANIYKSSLKIGGKDKTVVVINHKEDDTTKAVESKEVNVLHHIHVLDRSGSMYSSIDRLIENVKQTIDAMADNDFVSIVWFSSSGQYKTLIKGARKDDSLKTILDTIKSTLGCTCFSEPMQEVGEIIKELEAICPNFSVTLFTDGEPVTPWGDDEEYNRTYKAVEQYKDKIIALNTVGYGYCYNQEFLKKLSAMSEYGMMIHSSKIDEYLSIFSHNYERIADLVMDKVEIAADDSSIMYINSKSTKMDSDNLKMTMLEKKKNQFVVIVDGSDDDFDISYNGDVFNASTVDKEIPAATLTPVLYAYAYNLYYNGKRQEALDILSKNLKDKALINNQITAFTFDEVSAYSNKLRKCVFSSKPRYTEGTAPDDYLPADNAPCVMDILKILAAGDNYYVYAKNYNRIGLKTTDNFNLFEYNPGDILTPIGEYVFNKEQLNISVRSQIYGKVKLNPKSAARVGLPDTFQSYIYRNQTLIKDGNLNMDTITVVTDDDTLNKINSLGIADLIKSSVYIFIEGTGARFKVELDLTKLPIINRTYLTESGDIENIYKNIKKTIELECKQKILNYYVAKIGEANPKATKAAYTDYTDDQVVVLEEHGINKQGQYVGVDNQKAEKNENDFYEARILDFSVKGFATIPSMNAYIKKVMEGKKLNGPETVMNDFVNDLKSRYNPTDLESGNIINKDYLSKELKGVKTELINTRIELNSMKIAKVLTGGWFDKLTPDGKGGYTYINESDTLNVSTEKKKFYY